MIDVRKLGDKLVRHPVGEVFVLGISGEVLERQDGDRFDARWAFVACDPVLHITGEESHDDEGRDKAETRDTEQRQPPRT